MFWMPFGLKRKAKPEEESGPRYADMQTRCLAAAVDLLLLFSLFVGKHIRILSAGSCLEDLAMVRSEFARDFSDLLGSDFWFRE